MSSEIIKTLMATGLENLWIYKLAEGYHRVTFKEKNRYLTIAKGEAEETKRGILKSARKKFLSFELAGDIANEYTTLLKGINGDIKFLQFDDLETKKSKPETKNQRVSLTPF